MTDPRAPYYRRQARLREKQAALRARRKQRVRAEEDPAEKRERGLQRLRRLLGHYRAKRGLPIGDGIDVIAEWLGRPRNGTGSEGKNGERSAPPSR